MVCLGEQLPKGVLGTPIGWETDQEDDLATAGGLTRSNLSDSKQESAPAFRAGRFRRTALVSRCANRMKHDT
jgi:hypothetical protein